MYTYPNNDNDHIPTLICTCNLNDNNDHMPSYVHFHQHSYENLLPLLNKPSCVYIYTSNKPSYVYKSPF